MRIAAVALTALLLLGGGVRADDAPECFDCHAEKVDPVKFGKSTHGTLGCATCHTDIAGFPHPERPATPDCAACHDEPTRDVTRGVHGSPAQAGRGAPPACTDCHGDVHTLVPHTDTGSPMHWTKIAATCARCHTKTADGGAFRIPVVRPVEAYLRSVHQRAVAAGGHGAVCSDCHGSHAILTSADPTSSLARPKVAATCGKCHAEVAGDYMESIHGRALAAGARDAPTCTDCHGEHAILAPSDPGAPVFAANVAHEVCGRCHASLRLSEKYGMPHGQVAAYQDSFHGLALRAGQLSAANCGSCHGVHDIQPSSDPRSRVHAANLPATCGKCHPGAGMNFTLGPVHLVPGTSSTSVVAIAWIRFVYFCLISLVVGAMAAHNLLDLARKARRPSPPPSPRAAPPRRMSPTLRWQHGLVMVSFPVLAYTGFALTYPEAWWARPLLEWETKLALRGLLHRVSALVLLAAVLWHIALLAVSPRARACFRNVRWSWSDLRTLGRRMAWALGRRPDPPRTGTFSYVEKTEYWAFLWGTALMAGTGFLLWFETVSLRYLPKWVTDIATALHFYEGVLATLAIVVWHFYWVIFDPDVYPMDTTWWSGQEPEARAAERSEQESRQSTPP